MKKLLALFLSIAGLAFAAPTQPINNATLTGTTNLGAVGTINNTTGNIVTQGGITTGSGGTAAGYFSLGQGTAASTGTTNITFYAPTSVTSYKRVFGGTAGSTGFPLYTVSGTTQTESLVAGNGSGNVVLTTSPSIATPTITGDSTETGYFKATVSATAWAAGSSNGNEWRINNSTSDSGGTSAPTGHLFTMNLSGANNWAQTVAAGYYATHAGSGTVSTLQAALFQNAISSSGSVTTNRSITIGTTLSGSGNITTEATRILVATPTVSSTGDYLGTISAVTVQDIGRAAATTDTVFSVADQTKGSGNAYAYYSNMAAGSGGKYAFYGAGTAPSVLSGTLTIPTASPGTNSTLAATTAYADVAARATNLGTFASPNTAAGAITWTAPVYNIYTSAGSTRTYTLPAASSYTGQAFILNVAVGTGHVNVQPASGAQLVLAGVLLTANHYVQAATSAPGNYICFISDGTNWTSLGSSGTWADAASP